MDHIGSWATMVGYVHASDVSSCMFQGIVSSATALASSFYTLVIALYLYLVTMYGSVLSKNSMFIVHAFCIGFPLIVSTVPLAQKSVSYGNNDDEITWCFIESDDDNPNKNTDLIWMIFSFYLWIFLAIFATAILLAIVGCHLYFDMQVVDGPIVESLLKLVWYPVIFLVCWGLASFSDFYCRYKHDRICEYSVVYSTILSILQGFFCACVFFARNKIVRVQWHELVCRRSSSVSIETSKASISIETSKASIATTATMKVEDEVDYESGGEDNDEVDARVSTNNDDRPRTARRGTKLLRNLSSIKKSGVFSSSSGKLNVASSNGLESGGEGATENPLSSSSSSSSRSKSDIITMDDQNRRFGDRDSEKMDVHSYSL